MLVSCIGADATSLTSEAGSPETISAQAASHEGIRGPPDPDDPRLSVTVPGIDHERRAVETAVVTERPLTLFLNAREIVTMMTIGDRPDLLAVGYLLNQNMLKADDEITAIELRGGHRHRGGAHAARRPTSRTS